jgi:hypothetical protein
MRSQTLEKPKVAHGVGVRHNSPFFFTHITGYQPVCSGLSISDLKKNGLTYSWLLVAEKIGVEAMVGVAAILGSNTTEHTRVPSLRKIQFLILKKEVEGLFLEGKTAIEINVIFQRKGICISLCFIYKAIRGLRLKS